MLQMDLRNLVSSIVSQELRGKGRENEALYFNFEISLSYHTDERSYSESCGLHLLYHCKPDRSYISVFSGVTDRFAQIHSVKSWKHETTHDSCWRDISLFSDIYFGMADMINDQLEEDHLSKVPPK